MARKNVFSEIEDDVNFKKFTADDQNKLGGIAAGATVGATWNSDINGQPTTLSEFDSVAATSLAGKLSKSGGIMTGDIMMDTGARILLSGSPSNANEPISLSYFQTHKERSDFQADVKAKQIDGTTVPFQNAVQRIEGTNATAGTYTITFDGQTTTSLNHDADAATVQAAMESLSNVGSGNIFVTGESFSSETGGFNFEFKGSLAKAPQSLLTSTVESLTGVQDYAVTHTFVGFDVVAGDRYIISDVASMSDDFGTITGIEDNDIIEANAAGAFSVVYDVSERGEGVLVWNSSAAIWLNYKSSTGWSEHGGLSVYTAGNGLQLIEGVFSIKPDTTTGGNIVPVTANGNGTGIPVDNSTIKKNGFDQLYVDPSVLPLNSTTGFMYTVTEADEAQGYFEFPAERESIAVDGFRGVEVRVIGGSDQANASVTVDISHAISPDYGFITGESWSFRRVFINNDGSYGDTGLPLTGSIVEGDVLRLVYPYSVTGV